jgi:hypothetical protein
VLELLVLEFYGTAPRAFAIDKALPEFWGWARSRAGASVRPPGGRSAIEVGDKWQGKAKAAYWRATLAEHHAKEGRLVEAAVEWRQTLGETFPVLARNPCRTPRQGRAARRSRRGMAADPRRDFPRPRRNAAQEATAFQESCRIEFGCHPGQAKREPGSIVQHPPS